MTKQALTPYSDLDNAALTLELEAHTQQFWEVQRVQRDMESIISREEDSFLVQYAGIPVPLAELRKKLSLLEAELTDLKKAIKEGEAGLRTILPDVVDKRDAAIEQGKGWLEHMGLLLAEMSYRGIRGEEHRDVVLGHVEVSGKRHAMLAREIRNAQSWTFDAPTLLASLPAERRGFFTFEAKPGHGEISKKMCNEWLRRVIAEGTAPDGVAFAPMTFAKVGGDDLVYVVPIEGMSDADT